MSPHIAKRRDYPLFVTSVEAHTSPDGRYRDILRLNCGRQPGRTHRRLGIFIGANPSAADMDKSDATINKVANELCASPGPLWGDCNELLVVNLSPLRATYSAEAVSMLDDPAMLTDSLEKCGAAWGAIKAALGQGIYKPVIWVGWGDCLKRHTRALSAPFKNLLEGREVLHLPLLKNGEPGHPCRADLKTLRRSVLWPKPVIGPLVGCDTSPDADIPF